MTDKTKKPRWTQEEKDLLMKLVQEHTDKHCASILNKSISAIEQERRKLGVRRCRTVYKQRILSTDDTTIRLKELFHQNMSMEKIAHELKTSLYHLRKIIKSLGLKRKTIKSGARRGIGLDYADRVRSLYIEHNKCHEDIASELNISISQVKYIMARNKISRRSTWYKRWTKEEDFLVIKMLDEGADIDDISRAISRSDDAIIDRVSRMSGRSCLYRQICERRSKNRNEAYRLPEIIDKKMGRAKIKCQKRGLPFEIDRQFVLDLIEKQDGKCFYTGEALSYKPTTENFFSIDRLDSTQGYTKNNVVLCLSDVNYMKCDLLLGRFVNLCKLIAKHTESKIRS